MSSLESDSLKSQQEFYDGRWSEATERHDYWGGEARERIVAILEGVFAAFQTIERPLRILDLGCGNGWFTKFLEPFGRVTGVDLSKEGIRQATERYPGHEFVTASYFEFVNKDAYDVVVSQEVIEHIELDEQSTYLRRCQENLNSTGRLVLTTPNRMAVKAIRRGQGLSLDKLGDQPIENIMSRSELKRLLQEAFEIQYLKTVIKPRTMAGIYRLLNSGRLANMIPGLKNLRTRINANKHLVVVAKPRK